MSFNMTPVPAPTLNAPEMGLTVASWTELVMSAT
jgi:hypothetical protein